MILPRESLGYLLLPLLKSFYGSSRIKAQAAKETQGILESKKGWKKVKVIHTGL
jgi:hypothetical protein